MGAVQLCSPYLEVLLREGASREGGRIRGALFWRVSGEVGRQDPLLPGGNLSRP